MIDFPTISEPWRECRSGGGPVGVARHVQSCDGLTWSLTFDIRGYPSADFQRPVSVSVAQSAPTLLRVVGRSPRGTRSSPIESLPEPVSLADKRESGGQQSRSRMDRRFTSQR